MKPTREEIEQATKYLQDALIESLEADQELENAKLRQDKARKNLLLAKEAVSALRFY